MYRKDIIKNIYREESWFLISMNLEKMDHIEKLFESKAYLNVFSF